MRVRHILDILFIAFIGLVCGAFPLYAQPFEPFGSLSLFTNAWQRAHVLDTA